MICRSDLIMVKSKRQQIAEAKKLLEDNGYTILPPEQTQVRTADFDEWWELYDLKCGRADCIRKWAKLTDEEKIACIEATPAYVASTPDKQFRKRPLTYLNQKAFYDEIIIRSTEQQQRQQRLNAAAELIAKYGKKD